MNFGDAIKAMKEGKKVSREGWNGKGMFVYMMDGYPDGVVANEETKRKTGFDAVIIRPYFAMLDATGQIVVGWLASQTDMLAEDWGIIG